MRAYSRIGVATAMALALGGCLGLGGGKVPPSLFTLSPANSAAAGAEARGKPADVLMVMEPETDRRLAVQRVPVQIGAAEVAYLKDALWVERPAKPCARAATGWCLKTISPPRPPGCGWAGGWSKWAMTRAASRRWSAMTRCAPARGARLRPAASKA